MTPEMLLTEELRTTNSTKYRGWFPEASGDTEKIDETQFENILGYTETESYYSKNIGAITPKPLYAFIKRAVDIIVSVIVIIVFAIPSLIIGLAIKLDSNGPILYKQERIGLNGRKFNIIKFRSMKTDAEKNGAVWAGKDDDRITKVGCFLRKTHLDEFPQFVNVLKGDMSIVGPRPERLVFYIAFEEKFHGFSQRTMVKPGITGWASVNGGYGLGPKEKIEYDIEYIENRSLLFDLKIIFKTVLVMFSHEGAR